MKKILSKSLWLLFAVACFVLGGYGNVIMAAGTELPDAGKLVSGNGVENATDANNSGATTLGSQEELNDELLLKDIDERIMKIRPMSTPIENISRGIPSKTINSLETKYYAIGTRPTSTTLKTAVTAQTSGLSVAIEVADPSIFTIDDTIRVCGVKGTHKENGAAYAEGEIIPDLQLYVVGSSAESNSPVVIAINGNVNNNQATYLPAIPANTTLIRMGKACSEIDAQTGQFTESPTSEVQYCQNFMIQIEQSDFYKKWTNREVNWSFNDLEEEAVYDMKLTRELTGLFGVKNKVKHPTKKNAEVYFTGGVYWMAGKDILVGSWNYEKVLQADGSEKQQQVFSITDDDLVDISKDLFIGCASSGRKVLFCGSTFLQAMSKIKSDKFRLKNTVEIWDLKFKSWQTDFGEILTIHHELFNECGMSDCAFALEPDYLDKRVFIPLTRSNKDFKTAGIRNTEGVVLQEVSCWVLKNAKAHARLKLAPKAA